VCAVPHSSLLQEDGSCQDPGLLRQLELMRSAKLLRLALICQDMADGLMAVNDITGEITHTHPLGPCSVCVGVGGWVGGWVWGGGQSQAHEASKAVDGDGGLLVSCTAEQC